MSTTRNWTRIAITAVVAAAVAVGGPLADDSLDPEEAVRRAIAPKRGFAKRALALAELAWLQDDPAVSAVAKQHLVDYREDAFAAIHRIFTRVPKDRQVDAVETLIAARRRAGTPGSSFLPALETAVWFGTREARRLAIPELGRARFRPALLPIIDAALEDDALLETAVEALADMRDERARFFLEGILLEGPAKLRAEAALALARAGGASLRPLKEAMRSADRTTRLHAVRALLPFATADDLSALYAYAHRYPDDDPALVDSILELAAVLEKRREEAMAAEAASPMNPDE